MNVLISACLIGICCRYDGTSAGCLLPSELHSRYGLLPFCPEVCAGLPTPRDSVELRNGQALTQNAVNLTAVFEEGARKGLALYQSQNCHAAILKSKSPSCGYGTLYDGTFTRRLTEGNGIFADLLASHNVPIFNETQLQNCMLFLHSLSHDTP